MRGNGITRWIKTKISQAFIPHTHTHHTHAHTLTHARLVYNICDVVARAHNKRMSSDFKGRKRRVNLSKQNPTFLFEILRIFFFFCQNRILCYYYLFVSNCRLMNFYAEYGIRVPVQVHRPPHLWIINSFRSNDFAKS